MKHINQKSIGVLLFSFLFWFSTQVLAAPITLTFDANVAAPTYTENGMTITATGDNTDVSVFGAWQLFGSIGATAPAYSLTTGGFFDLISVDILHSDLGDPIVFNGYRNSILVANQTINANDFGFLSLSGFTGLDEVTIGVTGTFVDPDFDNLTYQVVPVPSAVWLFGSGLLGLVGMARRKKTA